MIVSIHTPAWGVTRERFTVDIYYVVSIHTPAWGVTAADATTADATKFQSTHPRGV